MTIDVDFLVVFSPFECENMTTAAVQGTLPESAGANLSISINGPREVEGTHGANGNGDNSLGASNAVNITSTGRNDDPSNPIVVNAASANEPNQISRIPYSSDASTPFQPQVDGIWDYPTPQQREDAPIDSALLSALRDSRERLGLLKLEKALIDFMNTSDGYIEVGGPYNSVVISPTKGMVAGASANPDRPHSTSFQRCILHRLADRFSIVRETGTLADGYIRLVKLKDSRIPKKLLLHLEPSEYNFPVDEAARSMEQMSINGQGLTSNNQNFAGASTGSKPKQRKMKIMKRNSSCSSNGSSKNSSGNGGRSTPRKSKNLSDREKAYAEARARIFADQQTDAGAGTSTGPNTPVASAAPSPATTPPRSRGATGSNNSLEDCAVAAEENDGKSSLVSNATAPKATWRNRRQEENDPDFQRGGGVVVQQAYGGDVYGGYAGGGGTSYPQHSSAQQHNYYPTYADDRTPYYGGQGQMPQHQPQQGYYANQGRGRGRGYGPNPRYGNSYHGNNNYYHQTNHYSQGRGGHAQPANVNSLDDFPSLR